MGDYDPASRIDESGLVECDLGKPHVDMVNSTGRREAGES